MTRYRKGAAGALLDEYEKAIAELKVVIAPIGEGDWSSIIDPDTKDDNGKSFQAIMTHVVSSAYSYATYIGQLKGLPVERPERRSYNSATAYGMALDEAFRFTLAVFEHVADHELEQPDEAYKIKTTWEQRYDIEQMMEHAIVHVLRHRRQIERLKAATGLA
jgi:uncharacterized damage-inducible protein DinB